MKTRLDESSRVVYFRAAHQMSGDVLRPVTAENRVHLVFDPQFHLFEPVLFDLLFLSETRLSF